MTGFARTRRVTDPFDDRVKDRIFSFAGAQREPFYAISGSQHSGQTDDNDESPSLSDLLLHCFLENDDGGGDDTAGDADKDDGAGEDNNESDAERDSVSDRTEAIAEALRTILLSQNGDRFRNLLLSHVFKALEVFKCVRPEKQILLRNVMMFLRNLGYNAAICKAKWESSGGLTAGNYEFVDVIRSDNGARYFVDLHFAGEFEIARQTSQYQRLQQILPAIYVGKGEELKQIVKLMSDAAKRSLKTRELILPPWRKNRFMQNKWFGPYKRTVNYIPAKFSPISVPAKKTPIVKCRSIGFNAVNSPSLLPAATRTR